MDLLRELMNFGSFWSIWFWIAHIIAWSLASHFAMGVPYDMIQEANREGDNGGPWTEATEALILAQVFRFTTLARRYGVVLVGATAFLLSVFVTLGVVADLEIARAIGTFLIPLTLIYLLTVRVAGRIDASGVRGRDLRKKIANLRIGNQLIGLLGIAMAVTLAIWEVARNIEPFQAW